MIAVANCMVETHELRLVLLAALVCLLAAGTTFELFPRVMSERRSASGPVWLLLAATVAGAGVWATHFIAMLAFRPLVPIAFEVSTTVFSILVAVGATAAAFLFAATVRSRAGKLAAGAMLGLSTVAMHYTGISGLRFPGHVGLNPIFVALSVVFSVALATPAIAVALGEGGRSRRYGAAALFALSVVSLHFTGMAAVTLTPDPAVAVPDDLLSGDALGYAVAAATVLIVACGLSAWLIDRRSRREVEGRMRFLARHDMLTALPNRLLFEEIVERELAGATAERSAALFCIDLDGFKEVNDIFGHVAGDALLVEVARRLRNLLGERCVAARLGGDEFAILATGLGQTKTAAFAAQSVLDALGAPFEIDGNRVDVGCSIGIALLRANGASYPVLLSNADVALSRAKGEGKGQFRFFEPAMDEALRERRRLAQDLRAALFTSQIRLEYQPQLDVRSNRVTGFEALLRWDHPVRGAVSPATFIPIAEETGIILPLGEWVLREACREAASWIAPLEIAVNLSVAQFRQSGLPAMVSGILAETGLSPARLELEVTESLFFDNATRSLQALGQIRETGVRIAMDDFGTGYSSLSTLQMFPFDKIKIDRSFTAQVGQARKGTAIVKAIVGLGESLDISVIAEGVETAEQLAFLREQHCTEVQGYLSGKPRPIADYRHLTSGQVGDNVVHLRSA